ncbi:AAA family ATPase [Halarcobacter anaerophilus]|uniref:Rad50/SbcC-type AAA domain-containing protein n=1 Tax=Halarcobacter anaerophilus TaxID=877500 RepID=A0A4Q0Y3V6_9BACT|nr:AAA family ATPase [Halarcobacter anaerophilus]QDF29158.1 hypothetical protein AANAER_1682 [Halarcobacter anaerophilus]RXJ64413.1 hypothetical protein CRV06_00195 [Halarcobacter anaerophilus]
MMKIKEIQFANFRAYQNETFKIDTNKKIVLLYARNGFGKTSFFDGIEWGLTGKIERYEKTEGRERKEYSVLRNTFASSNINDGIKIVFDDGSKIKRFIKDHDSNDYDEGILNINGQVENKIDSILVKNKFKKDIQFDKSFNYSILLSQELISDFIRHTKDGDRYRTIVDLFGLSSFKEYDEHIKSSQQYLKDELKDIQENITVIDNDIKVKSAKLVSSDIDFNQSLLELKNFDKTVKINNLSEVKSSFLELYKNKNQKKLFLEKTLNDLEKLKQNFTIKEPMLQKKDLVEKQYREYKEFIYKFDKKVYVDNIENNIKNFDIFITKQEDIKKVNLELEKLDSMAKSHSFFNKFEKSEDQIRTLADYGNQYLERVNQYFNSLKIQREQKNTLNRLEEDLQRISSIKKELYYMAKKFLEDKENKELKNCPVCENEFDINNTIDKLTFKLEKNQSEEFNEINKSIKTTKNLIETNSVWLNDEEKTLLEICENIKNKYREQYKTLLFQSKEYDKLIESNKIVNENLQLLNIKIQEYQNFKVNYLQDITSSKFFNEGMSIDYYKNNIKSIYDDFSTLKRDTEDYNTLKEKYKVISLEDINIFYRDTKDEYKKVILKLDEFEKVKELIDKLILEIDNNEQKKQIDKLILQLELLNTKKRKLLQIDNDYSNLKDSIKLAIDNETQILLANYKDTISKFYHYLNPNIYMNDLTIKETKDGVNRLVFEVQGESGKKHSPSYIFSSAQNNVLALSIFLTFAIKQQWSNLDSIFLDDPIQNMDDINIHSLVDIIRSIQNQTNKQFFISTHDERIYKFMLNKFGEENVQSFKFSDYGTLE